MSLTILFWALCLQSQWFDSHAEGNILSNLSSASLLRGQGLCADALMDKVSNRFYAECVKSRTRVSEAGQMKVKVCSEKQSKAFVWRQNVPEKNTHSLHFFLKEKLNVNLRECVRDLALRRWKERMWEEDKGQKGERDSVFVEINKEKIKDTNSERIWSPERRVFNLL